MNCGITNCPECGGPCPTRQPICDICYEKRKLETCDHPDFNANVAVNRLSDIKRFNADITISCAKCGKKMRFLGLPRGLDLNGATINIDGTVANLAIHPVHEPIPDIKGTTGFTLNQKGPDNERR